jgi:hypothetical protein
MRGCRRFTKFSISCWGDSLSILFNKHIDIATTRINHPRIDKSSLKSSLASILKSHWIMKGQTHILPTLEGPNRLWDAPESNDNTWCPQSLPLTKLRISICICKADLDGIINYVRSNDQNHWRKDKSVIEPIQRGGFNSFQLWIGLKSNGWKWVTSWKTWWPKNFNSVHHLDMRQSREISN